MGIFGGKKKARLVISSASGEQDAESLLIRLRSGQTGALLEECGWSAQEKPLSATVCQGLRRYLYEVQEHPGARMDFRAVSFPDGAGRVELVLTGPREQLVLITPVLERIGAMLREQAQLSQAPVVRGVRG